MVFSKQKFLIYMSIHDWLLLRALRNTLKMEAKVLSKYDSFIPGFYKEGDINLPNSRQRGEGNRN